MNIYTAERNGFCISTDKSKLDIAVVHGYLCHHAYWCKNIPIEKVERSIAHSFCFGLYKGAAQVGFARLITDYTTYAYLADVFILPAYRGLGLSKWLMAFITGNPEVQGLRRWVLATQDAHGLYAQFGFAPYDRPERLMHRKDIEGY
jgi:GNAT superfamily N-acetyltransferase